MDSEAEANASLGVQAAPPPNGLFQNLAVVNGLGVGYNSYVTNTPMLQVNGSAEVDGTATVYSLAFAAGQDPSTAVLSADTQQTGQLGLSGSLRIQTGLGLGTAAADDLSTLGRLVLRGADTGAVPLQLWQSATATPLGVVDAQGQLGIGTTQPSASLSVQGTFLLPLSGTVSGKANVATLTGSGTAFDTELKEGDAIRLPLAGGSTIFRVKCISSPTELKLETDPTANFQGAKAYTDGPLMRVQDGSGREALALNRRGDLSLGGRLKLNGHGTIHSDLTVDGTASLGTLKVSGAANIHTSLEVKGPATLGGLTVTGNQTLRGDLVVTGTAAITSLDVSGKSQVTIDAKGLLVDGRVGLGTRTPDAALHIRPTQDQGVVIQDGRAAGSPSYIEWRKADGSPDWRLGRAADGTFTLVLTSNDRAPALTFDASGVVRAPSFVSTSPLSHRMYPSGPRVYLDIFDARDAGAIAKLGSPTYNDTTWTRSNPWNGRPIIEFGSNNETDGNGAVVTIPDGYDTLWVRVLGDRWNRIHAYYLDGAREDLGLWSGGFRKLNNYSPDGSAPEDRWSLHQWFPIAAGRPGRVALISKPETSAQFWLSGLAFSRNPWAHATRSGVDYHWDDKQRGGNGVSYHDQNDWNNDQLARINPGRSPTLSVPVVGSGRDKLLYVVEHNSNWNSCVHTRILVNGTEIERFLTTYDNPFARHWGSKLYARYIAARVPAQLAADRRFLDVQIDMTRQDNYLHFREIGTHDLEVPTS
jgi:hypothetical protein